MADRQSRRLFPLIVAVGCLSCFEETVFPGDETMGAFSFEAQLRQRDCDLNELATEAFSFEGTFSRDKESSDAYFNLRGVTRSGTFDGQVLTSIHQANRRFTVSGGNDIDQRRCACTG